MDHQDRKKTIAAAAFACVSLLVLGYLVMGSLGIGTTSAAEASRRRTLIDMKSKEVFENHPIPDGETWPLKNPKTGEDSLVPAEACYWTKEGGAKLVPTWVLLESYIGGTNPTPCPDCGRPVMPHNAMPPPAILEKAK
jgi:hypothetical protein